MRAWHTIVIAAAAAAFVGGCSPSARDATQAPPIARVHEHQCGRCHMPPEPKTRTRGHLEEAFTRHRNRVHLTDEQWAAMVEYLAAPQGAMR